MENENEKIVNGVSVTNLFDVMSAIKENPNISKFNFRAKGKWINGGYNQTVINDFDGACQTHIRNQPFVFDKDEPPVLLGKDQGANPVEYALAALNGCFTTSLIYHAAAQGIKIEEVESTLSGNLDIQGLLGMSDKVRNDYEKIKVIFKVKADAPEEKIKELVDIAQKRSPVFDIISHPTPVEVSLQR
ncbi:OsmC family protein [Candidatus Nitrosocosmicus agrestis]|uniref:OsmC family protein n=1 Tax=Candidatus Nitrosocosmicus agrestis TaxID=2563600 RepID=UPI001917207F|nr:OsmC family protein [Candidatus Nitrosocosmicus sp. SS]MDR4490344.1 OsmC family protein [Candidatus Nitrosocosmicus sp.]